MAGSATKRPFAELFVLFCFSYPPDDRLHGSVTGRGGGRVGVSAKTGKGGDRGGEEGGRRDKGSERRRERLENKRRLIINSLNRQAVRRRRRPCSV